MARVSLLWWAMAAALYGCSDVRAAIIPAGVAGDDAAQTVVSGGGFCSSDWNCSLAGVCADKKCVCDPWMTGSTCGLLNLVTPVDPAKQGLQVPGYFSWGGHAAWDETDKVYQGFFSFMCKHQTLAKWTTVSSVMRATSVDPEGPYTPAEMIIQPWAHNTMLVYDPPSQKHILFFIGTAAANESLWSPCYESGHANVSNALDGPAQGTFAPPEGPQPGDVSAATSSGGLTGKWTMFTGWKPAPAIGNNPEIHFTQPWSSRVVGNPAPFIFENGTTLLYFSAQPCPAKWGRSATCINVARAATWQGPYTTVGQLPVTRPESEDAFVFRDARGHFHLLTNVNTGHQRCSEGVACGGHAWSYDGITFSDLDIGAYGPRIPLRNGTIWQNSYIERPQVLQDSKGNPVAFFTGMGRSSYHDSCSWVQRFCQTTGDPTCAPTGKLCPWKNVTNGSATVFCT